MPSLRVAKRSVERRECARSLALAMRNERPLSFSRGAALLGHSELRSPLPDDGRLGAGELSVSRVPEELEEPAFGPDATDSRPPCHEVDEV